MSRETKFKHLINTFIAGHNDEADEEDVKVDIDEETIEVGGFVYNLSCY